MYYSKKVYKMTSTFLNYTYYNMYGKSVFNIFNSIFSNNIVFF